MIATCDTCNAELAVEERSRLWHEYDGSHYVEVVLPYEVVTAPLGNRFGARSLEEVEHFKTIWTVTHVIDNTEPTEGQVA